MLCMAIGGPIDGSSVTVSEGDLTYEHEGPPFSPRRDEDSVADRGGHKVYLYEVDPRYRSRMHYVGEDVVWDDEEVSTGGNP